MPITVGDLKTTNAVPSSNEAPMKKTSMPGGGAAANTLSQETKGPTSPSGGSFGAFSFKNALTQVNQGGAPSAPLTGVSVKAPTPTPSPLPLNRNGGGRPSQQQPPQNNKGTNPQRDGNNRRRNSHERTKPPTEKFEKPTQLAGSTAPSQPAANPVVVVAASSVAVPVVPASSVNHAGGLMFGSLPPRVQSAPPNVDDPAIVSMQKAAPTTATVPEEKEVASPVIAVVQKTEECSAEMKSAANAAPYHPPHHQAHSQLQHQHQNQVPPQHYAQQQAYYGQGMPYYGPSHGAGYRYPQSSYYHPKYSTQGHHQQYQQPQQGGGYYQHHQGGYRPYYNNNRNLVAALPVVDGAAVPVVAATEPQPSPAVFVPPTMPARRKIAIVDPDTGKEVDLGVPKIIQPDSSAVQASSTSGLPARKPLVLIDPSSNKPIDLSQMTRAEAEKAVADDEGLTMPEIDERDAFEGGISDSDYSYSGSGEFSEGDDDLLDEFPVGMEFPVILTRDLKVEYPPNAIAFTLPPEGEPIKYSSEFLLQFENLCKGAAQDIKAIAFPDQVIVRQNRAVGRQGKGATQRPHHHRHHQQYSAEQLSLSNRAENAWKRLKDSTLEEDAQVVIEVKGFLNKISENNFENITEKILSLPILNSDGVLSQVIDLFFDKAVEEPRYAPLYSRLCSRITDAEIDKKKMTQSAEEFAASEKNIASHSIFRKLLVTKCQQEYEVKQAYSRSRIERLMSKAIEEGQISAEASSASLAAMTTGGDLTEEDYVLLKTKRRVLGNMRFIGELFIAGLIGSKIMYTVIQELLTEIVEPEEEEVESACRLISTVGPILDNPESAVMWGRYVNRMNVLAENKKLPTRVRFMVLDVLEARARGWRKPGPGADRGSERERGGDSRGGSDHHRPHPSASPAPSSTSARSGASSTDRQYRSGGDRRDRERERDDHPRSGTVRYSSARKDAPSASNQDVRFEKVVAKNGSRPRPPSSITNATNQEELRPPSRPSSTINETSNRYLALEEESIPVTLACPYGSESMFDGAVSYRKLCAVFEESMKQKNHEDVVAIFTSDIPQDHRGDALKAFILHVMDHGKAQVDYFVTFIGALLIPHLTPKMVKCGLASAWEMIDDLAVDLPQAWEFAGMILSVFVDAKLVTISEIPSAIFPKLSQDDPNAVGRVMLYTLKSSHASANELKEAIGEDGLLSSHRAELDSLIARLELVHLF